MNWVACGIPKNIADREAKHSLRHRVWWAIKNGATIEDLSKKLKCSYSAIVGIAQRAEVEMRGPYSSPLEVYLNQHEKYELQRLGKRRVYILNKDDPNGGKN